MGEQMDMDDMIDVNEIEVDVPDESKSDKFFRIANSRAKKAIKMIRLLRNCANTQTYEYSVHDSNLLCEKLEEEVYALKSEFTRALNASKEVEDIF